MAEEIQEGQKTVVSFVVGLLIGGLLVWAFSGPAPTDNVETESEVESAEEGEVSSEEEPETNVEDSDVVVVEKPVLAVGDGKISVKDQPASDLVTLSAATYPVSEGWIGVRDYVDGQLGGLLGVVRFSEEQGLVPAEISLLRATKAGQEYAVVVYQENGDREFNIAEDVQIDTIFSTFTAK